MGFYDVLSVYYDELFPASPATCSFLELFLPPGGSALDLACGSGAYARALARRGYRVTGLDLDRAMIGRAQAKSRGENPLFVHGDMRCVKELLPGPFDLVFCIGNSLPHLPDHESIGVVLRDVADVLCEGGALVVQTVNFDRICAEGAASFPPLETARVRFERGYRFGSSPGHVTFVGTLVVKGEGPCGRISHQIELCLLRRRELENLLKGAGFNVIQLFGDFTQATWTPGSPATVAAARR